jgi:hypothetical protein
MLIYRNVSLCFYVWMADSIDRLSEMAVGNRYETTRHEYNWGFGFAGKYWLMVECPWRIVNKNGIVFANQDDGQKFDLPAPVDGEAKAQEAIGGFALTSLSVDRSTADVTFSFENGSRVDVFNNSMGYEGWQAGFDTEQGEVLIIGCGGGQVVIVAPKNGS